MSLLERVSRQKRIGKDNAIVRPIRAFRGKTIDGDRVAAAVGGIYHDVMSRCGYTVFSGDYRFCHDGERVAGASVIPIIGSALADIG